MSNRKNNLKIESLVRNYIREIFHSFPAVPSNGDKIVNVNPSCKHYKSKGVVDKVNSLPGDKGKTVVYITTNSGKNWDIGDILEKTIDQLEIDY